MINHTRLNSVWEGAGNVICLDALRAMEKLPESAETFLLLRHGDPAVADAFCASRLGGDGGRAYGTLPPGLDFAAVVERHRPRL